MTKDNKIEKRMPITQHLEELRSVAIKCLLALVAGVAVGYIYHPEVWAIISTPFIEVIEETNDGSFVGNQEDADVLLASIREKSNVNFNVNSIAEAKSIGEELFKEKLISSITLSEIKQLKDEKNADFTKLYQVSLLTTKKNFKALLDALAKTKPDLEIVRISSSVSGDFDNEQTLLFSSNRFMQNHLVSWVLLPLQLSLIAGLVLSSPFIFYFIWSFLESALFPNEKKLFYSYGFSSLFLFLGGIFFFYFAAQRYFIWGMYSFNTLPGVALLPDPGKYIKFWIMISLLMGIAFELPLVMMFLNRVGIANIDFWKSKRRYAYFILSALSAILTPADLMTMLLMAIPLILLYEIGIFALRMTGKKQIEKKAGGLDA